LKITINVEIFFLRTVVVGGAKYDLCT